MACFVAFAAALMSITHLAYPRRVNHLLATSDSKLKGEANRLTQAHSTPEPSSDQVTCHECGPVVQLETQSLMWIDDIEAECSIRVYSTSDPKVEIVTITKGQMKDAEDVPARVHSECFTGDILGSQRCDCGQQLHNFLRIMNQEDRGVLMYVRGHEGRGIGLANKIRAYQLQDEGFDTVDANLELGLPIDSRTYLDALAVFRDLGLRTIRIFTNNPDKIAALKPITASIAALASVPTAHSLKYLTTKKERCSHQTVLETLKLQEKLSNATKVPPGNHLGSTFQTHPVDQHALTCRHPTHGNNSVDNSVHNVWRSLFQRPPGDNQWRPTVSRTTLSDVIAAKNALDKAKAALDVAQESFDALIMQQWMLENEDTHAAPLELEDVLGAKANSQEAITAAERVVMTARNHWYDIIRREVEKRSNEEGMAGRWQEMLSGVPPGILPTPVNSVEEPAQLAEKVENARESTKKAAAEMAPAQQKKIGISAAQARLEVEKALPKKATLFSASESDVGDSWRSWFSSLTGAQ